MVKSETLKFIMGGKFGDFIHSLYAVKSLCNKYNKIADLYIYNIGWDFGIENTYKEMYDVIINQDYINSFQILNKDLYQLGNFHNSPILLNDNVFEDNKYIDLGDYIRSPYLYKECWTKLYSKTFNFDINLDMKWINISKKENRFLNKVIIHRKYGNRLNEHFPYSEIIKNYSNNIIFISSNNNDYEYFPYKDYVDFIKINTLEEWFTAINSCSMYVGNLTGPTAIAHSLDVLRIVELPLTVDSYHCIGEEQFSQNIKWFFNNKLHNLT